MSKRSFQNPFKSGRRKSKWRISIEAELRQHRQRVELFSALTLKIRQSLQLKEVLQTAVSQVQHILQVDRVLIYQVLPNGTGKAISEAVLPEYPTLMNLEFPPEVFPEEYRQLYAQGRVRAIANVHDPSSGVSECLVNFLKQFGVQSKLIVPIVQLPILSAQNHLWGLLIAHQCHHPRQWIKFELELMQQLADQISIALTQAYLLEHTAELKAANHNLQKEIHTRNQAEAALRQREEFISIVSHELRTPLTSIHSALKVLATGRLGKLSAEGQQMLAIADKSAERLIRLANNVLDLQRIESGKVVMERHTCNAANLMMQAVEAMQAIAQQHKITLITRTQDLLLQVDPDHIVQVLINLLSNAIKFSSPEGTVWLTVELSFPEVTFRVRDEGQGIPVDRLEQIFEQFQQINASDSRKKGGTGLGLAICRKIIEQHQGKIWAESRPGYGSTFAFTLPALPH